MHKIIEIFADRAALHTEILALRQQVAVLKRKRPRPLLRKADRVFWVILSCLWPGWRHALVIVRPETVIGWHRKGFRLFWTWKSRRGKPGRPPVSREIRYLVRRMSRENTRWGAPRIHGELLKLGFSISQAAVSKYMVRYPSPPSQSWRTFLSNHADCLAPIDFFVVPTAMFHLLFGFIVLHHERRQIVHFAVTANPTMAWVAQQIREAFPWGTAPRYLIRDRDGAYGQSFRSTVTAMGVEEVVTAPRSPWQNPYVERLIDSVRRECLDHSIILNERHLRRIPGSYLDYYLGSRTHLSIGKDTPDGLSMATENCTLLTIENQTLQTCGRTPRRGVGGVWLGVAVGNRVGAATATSLAATTRLSTADGRHRSCLRFGRRSRRTPLAASIRVGLQQVLVIPHPVGVPPDVDDVAVVHETVDEGRRHDFVAEHAAPVLEALVRGQHRRRPLVPGVDELEEEHGAVLVNRQVANLVDHQQGRMRQHTPPPRQVAGGLSMTHRDVRFL